jgi:acetyl esterase/lipase
METNVIFGMYSGLALLMDIYHPRTPKRYGILFIAGSGFNAPLSYDAERLKQNKESEIYALPLTDAGYTVFSINHRATPRFRYPAPVEDAQRAVWYIRYHASDYGIDPKRIGAVGSSSGGYLVSMLGVLDGAGDPKDASPINRESAKVQCVVATFAPCDLLQMGTHSSLLGMYLLQDPNSTEFRLFFEASPISHVATGDPPFLLIHGDADQVVPFDQSVQMERALKEAGVPVKLLCIPGGGHGPTFGGIENPPDYIGEMIRWFDQHLC